MSPLSGIPQMMSSYGVMPDADVMQPKALQTRGVDGATPLDQPSEVTPGQAAGNGDSFGTMLGNLISDVNTKQNTALQTVSGLEAGQNVPLHQAVIAMEEANVSFQLMVEVRNKLLDSYQELMRMQI